MLKDIKTSLKLMKYAYNYKLTMVCMIVILVIGILMTLIDEDSFAMGAFYILLAPSMMVQLLYNLLYSQLVAVSPKRKKFELAYPNIFISVSSIGLYILLAGAMCVLSNIGQGDPSIVVSNIVAMSIMLAILIIYFGVCYKYYVAGIIFLMVMLILVGFPTMDTIGNLNWNKLTAFLVGLIIVVVGTALSILLRKALYKKALSPMAGGVALRKAIQ